MICFFILRFFLINVKGPKRYTCTLLIKLALAAFAKTENLPNTRMNSVLRETTQKTCSRNTREPSSPNN